MQENSLIKKNILKLIDYKGISKYKFYQETGITRGILDQNNGMSEENIAKFLACFPEINSEWLLTGKGSMLKPLGLMSEEEIQQHNKEVTGGKWNAGVSVPQAVFDSEVYQSLYSKYNDEIKRNAVQTDDSDVKAVYLYDVNAAAGFGSFDEMISKERVVGKYIIPDFKDVDWMIYVKGSSMYPKYSSGDIIACRELHESRFIQWGKVYVVATREQGILVKRLKKSNLEDCILAVSDNPNYDSFDIPKDEILGIALVVGVIRLE